MNDIYNRKDEEFSVIGEVPESFKFNDPLYKEGFQAGAASRDAEVAKLKDDNEYLYVAAIERDHLREQVEVLREALDVCAETFSIPVIRETAKEALAATEPKITKPT